MSIEDNNAGYTNSKTDCIVLFNITFTKSTGDLEIEVQNTPE
jgi:hypothetical protein